MSIKIGGPFSKVDFVKYDLNSPAQLKEFLFSLGWVPDEWNINKETKERTSPKITESSLLSIGSSDLGRWIGKYYTIKHRRQTLENIKDPENKGLLSYVDEDGMVEADAFTVGTPTLRMRHKPPIVNVPKCDKNVPYGCEMRQIYCCIYPYFMMGSDLSGVEARLLGHFTSFFDDGEMARELLNGDIHSKNAKLIGKDRNTAKTFFYALLYGSGVAKQMAILGCSRREAEKIIKDFFDGNPGLCKLMDHLKAFYKKHKYIKAINGTRLMIRSEHVLLNSLIQASAAILFKRWGCYIWREIDRLGLDAAIIIAYHDEYQLRVHEKDVEVMKVVLRDTLQEVKEFYKISVDLATDTKVGFNWRSTH